MPNATHILPSLIAPLFYALICHFIGPASANPSESPGQNTQTNPYNRDSPTFPYFSVQAGAAFPSTLNGTVDILNFKAAVGNSLELNTGFNAEASLGYKWRTVRSDISASYASFDSLTQINSVAGYGSISNPGKGNVALSSLMLNAYYDIPIYGDNESNQLRFNLSSNQSSLNTILNQSIELWDPIANERQGAWVPYQTNSTYIPPRAIQQQHKNRFETLLLRIPLRNLQTNKQPFPITLTVRNGNNITASATALVADNPNAIHFTTQIDDPRTTVNEAKPGVLPPTESLPLRAEYHPQSNNQQPRTQREKNISPVLTINSFTVSSASSFAVFSIDRRQAPSRWSPYLGAGLGIANIATPGCAISTCTIFQGGADNTFAFQVKAGLSYRINNTSSLFLEGAYLQTEPFTINTVSYDPFSFWKLNLGWRQRL